ncbi:MAG: diacylglycerol/lipid kinase family protein [Spirochaetales bacterium]
MDPRKTLIVINPVAHELDAEGLQDMFRSERSGEAPDVYVTEAHHNVLEVVRDRLHKDIELIVAAGGDGTVSSCAGAIQGTDKWLGIMPLGTGNVIAKDLGIPTDLEKAASVIRGPHSERKIDLLQCDEQYSLLNVGAGLSPLIMDGAGREAKQRFGLLAYIASGLKKAFGYQPHRFTVTIDGQEQVFDGSEVIILNSPSIGHPALRLDDGILMDDGEAQVCVLRSRNLWQSIVAGVGMIFGRGYRNRQVSCYPAYHKVTIDSEDDVLIQGDGDIIGHTPADVRLIPKAVRVLVPREATSE